MPAVFHAHICFDLRMRRVARRGRTGLVAHHVTDHADNALWLGRRVALNFTLPRRLTAEERRRGGRT